MTNISTRIDFPESLGYEDPCDVYDVSSPGPPPQPAVREAKDTCRQVLSGK